MAMKTALNWVRRAYFGASPEKPESPAPRTFDEAQKHYHLVLDTRNLSSKALSNKRRAMHYLETVFTGQTIGAIRPFEIARLIRAIHDAGKHVTSRQVLSVARDLFNEALLQGWVDMNPALHVKRLPAPVRRERLTLDDFVAIHAHACRHAPSWFPIAMRLALLTGQRRSDIVRLRFSDVHDDHLFIEQHKTGARVAIPLALRLEALGCSVADVIHEARQYEPLQHDFMIRTEFRPRGYLGAHNLSVRFSEARKNAVPEHAGPGTPPTFHEIRSLSARLYRKQGVDTQTLLGHSKASMTEIYENDRGLHQGQWKYVSLPAGDTLP